MTATRIVLVVASVALVCAIAVARKQNAPRIERADPIQARLELAAGEVSIDQQDKKGARRAMSGTALRERATVATKAGARALVRLPDGSTTFLRGDTTCALAADGMRLEAGEYWLDAPPEDRVPLVHLAGEVRVTAADAGLSIKKTASGALVYVARGMAVVDGPGGRAEVGAGELATVESKSVKVEPLAFWEDWTGGLADYGTAAGSAAEGNGAIFATDPNAPPGSPSQRLQIARQSVRAAIRHGLSETEVDQTFFNPSAGDVEGWYWFTVPSDASVTGFAVETDGQLVEGELIVRNEARRKYAAARASGNAPALLEWVSSRTYRARIWPVKASSTRRVVVRYIQLHPIVDGKLEYIYPMGRGAPARIGELSLRVDLGAEGENMKLASVTDARVEDGGKRVTMRRSGFTPRADFQLEATLAVAPEPLRVSRFQSGPKSADYLMARYVPEVDWSKAKDASADVVLVVDTSAGGDESARAIRGAMAESLLRALGAGDRFALVSLDVQPKVLYPKEGLGKADDAGIAAALEALADHATGGATDLSASFDVALSRVHQSQQPAVVYIGDGLATSGALGGAELVERLRRSLGSSRARLFTVAVGAGADDALLHELARVGGGQSFEIDHAQEVTARALELAAAFKVPTITELEIDLGAGLDEPFSSTAGKVSKGSEVIVLARSHHDIPDEVTVRGNLAGTRIEQKVKVVRDRSVVQSFVPRLWAAEYVRRLLGSAAGVEIEQGRIATLGLDYGLMTPYTSFLALESESAYRQHGIERRRSPLRGVKLTSLDPRAEERLADSLLPRVGGASAFGCQGNSASPPEDQEPEGKPAEAPRPNKYDDNRYGVRGPADNKEGGAGTRAKGEEGSMGNPGSAARQEALREASEFGVIGLLNSGAGGGGRAARPSSGLESSRDDKPAKNEQDKPRDPRASCSAVSSQPLGLRARVWRKRLKNAEGPGELTAMHRGATLACELSDWLAERTFLDILAGHVRSEGAANVVLGYFADRGDVQRHVARLLLRRAVDERLVDAVKKILFGGAVDWNKVDLELSEIADLAQRLATLRKRAAAAPDDPEGQIRLVSLLARAGQTEAALRLGRRLRDRGLLTVHIARQLGDVLARERLDAEAVRTYSEIVEFDPESTSSRRLLGDIFLARGWHEPAYRQYKTITIQAPNDPLGLLRLAAAAAGTGRVDEALRIERGVASSQGRPGPDDPRRWARLWSAARIARLLHQPPKGTSKGALERKLKELQLFSGSGVLVILTWDDLGADVELVSEVGKDKEQAALGEHTDAAAAGLSARMLSAAQLEGATLVARLRSAKREEPLALTRHDIRWDGNAFLVAVERRELAPGDIRAPL